MISILVIVAIMLVFGYMLYRMEKNKRTESNLHGPIPINGFADVHVTKTCSAKESSDIAIKLSRVQRRLWKSCKRVYTRRSKIPWIVDKVAVVDGDVESGHPEVVWHTGANRIVLKLQPSMEYWFARECHNVFRYQLNDAAEEEFNEVERLIAMRYKRDS